MRAQSLTNAGPTARTAPPSLAFRTSLIIFVLSAGVILGAWGIEFAGYPPCELCLAQRWPYYIGVPLAAVVTFVAANRVPRAALVMGFILLALVFLVSFGLGGYHAGVEWQFWPGPTACTGSQPQPRSMAEFRRALDTVHVVPCDAVALRILGLSLAAWNTVASLLLTALAIGGAWIVSRRQTPLRAG